MRVRVCAVQAAATHLHACHESEDRRSLEEPIMQVYCLKDVQAKKNHPPDPEHGGCCHSQLSSLATIGLAARSKRACWAVRRIGSKRDPVPHIQPRRMQGRKTRSESEKAFFPLGVSQACTDIQPHRSVRNSSGAYSCFGVFLLCDKRRRSREGMSFRHTHGRCSETA